MTNCPNQQKNQQACTCTYDCPTKGICCECIAYHRSRKELPACYFTAKGERSYDRSIANYLRENS